MFAGLAAGVWLRRFSLHSFPIISMISHPVLYIGVSSFLFQPFSSLNGFGKSNWIFGETMRKNWYKLFSQRHCLILWLFVVHLRLFGLSACCCVAFQASLLSLGIAQTSLVLPSLIRSLPLTISPLCGEDTTFRIVYDCRYYFYLFHFRIVINSSIVQYTPSIFRFMPQRYTFFLKLSDKKKNFVCAKLFTYALRGPCLWYAYTVRVL